MSKKHFEAAAAKIRQLRQFALACREAGHPQQADLETFKAEAMENFCLEFFAQFSGKFNNVQFVQACRP